MTENIDDLKSGDVKKIKKNIRHKYFEGHECSIPPEKQAKYIIKCGKFRRFILYLISVRSGDVRAQHMYRSHSAFCAEEYRQFADFPFTIHPFSRLKLAVEALTIVVLIVCYTFNLISFVKDGPDLICETIIMICEVLYFINITCNFFTGYITGKTCPHVVLNLKEIIWRYFRSTLVLDFLFIFGLFTNEFRDNVVTLGIAIYTIKIARLPLLFQYSSNLLEVIGAGVVIKTAAEVALLITSYIIWNIYFQFGIEYLWENSFRPENPRECSWMTITKMWNSTTVTRFSYATNRAVAMLRQNSNINVLKETGCSENYIIISWILAKLIEFHCIIKYMIVLFGLESARANYVIMTRQVSTYMNQRKFPDRLKKKVLKYYAARFQSQFFVESRMMACLSGQLREDILMHSGRQLVNQVEFLKKLPRGLLLKISNKLKLVIFLAGDIIFKINTTGDCLYFIDKGTVAIYSETGKEICHLQDDDFFGEIALVMRNRFRTASAVAVTNCELFRLDKKDFESTIACYPTVYEDIKKVASHRLERTIVKDEHHKDELRMGYQMKEHDF